MDAKLFELAKAFKKCNGCSEVKPISMFYLKNKNKGYRESKCSCCKNKIRNKYPQRRPAPVARKTWFEKLPEDKQQILVDNFNLTTIRNLSVMLGVEYHTILYQKRKGNLMFILTERQQKENKKKAESQDKVDPNELVWEACSGCGRNELSCRCGWTAEMAGYDGDQPNSFLMFERDD